MYLHIGWSRVVPFSQIVGVFDLDKVSHSARAQQSLDRMEQDGRVEAVGERLPLSLVLTTHRAYLSPITSQALLKRLAENEPL